MWVRVNTQKPLMAVLVGMVAVAWVTLWVWGQSPYGRFLSHEDLGHIQFGEDLLFSLLFVAGWTLMTVAMMLPTSLPLVALFYGMTSQRQNRLRLLLLLLSGYLGLWTLFGVVVHLGDFLLHDFVASIAWLEHNRALIGAGTLVLAGVYQFTPLKYQCLDKCRSPMSFIAGHWRGGRREGLQALMLGVHHALFCIGCCWALMLLMFAVGAGSIGWMLVLGLVMAIEKNAPWGRRLSAPLGLFLVGMGFTLGLGSVLGVLGEHLHS
jgi:predicted metal-binding membrane protein